MLITTRLTHPQKYRNQKAARAKYCSSPNRGNRKRWERDRERQRAALYVCKLVINAASFFLVASVNNYKTASVPVLSILGKSNLAARRSNKPILGVIRARSIEAD